MIFYYQYFLTHLQFLSVDWIESKMLGSAVFAACLTFEVELSDTIRPVTSARVLLNDVFQILRPDEIIALNKDRRNTEMTKVLIVDDNSGVRDFLRAQLESMGFAAITAENGRRGVETAIVEKPTLILMDLMMPEMDGYAASSMLRTHPETKDVPILAVTALSGRADLQRCMEAGCNDYLVKPFTSDKLLRKIKALID